MTTNVPKPSFTDKGFVAPIEKDILDGTIKDIIAAFGGGLNPRQATSQGQLALTIAAYLGYVNDTFVHFANQVDPSFSEGRMQDAIARIYFISRKGETPTIVNAICTGLAGAIIPAGSLAADSSGNVYKSLTDATIPQAGNIAVDFACTVPGPIPCLAGTLTQIYRGAPGWDTVFNPLDGAIGRAEEKRAEFESRRALSVAKNARGMLAAVRGAVLAIDDVIDCYCAENNNNLATIQQGVWLVRNSIFVCVHGGASEEIARAIFSKKIPGCAYTGDTTVKITETDGFSPPYPVYSVTFQRAVELRIVFNVEILRSLLIPYDAEAQIALAIKSAMDGDDGSPRPKIAAELLASRFYSTVRALGDWAQIVNIKLGSSNTPQADFMGSIAVGVLSVHEMIGGSLRADDFIFTDSASLPTGATIASQIDGADGGIGRYALIGAGNANIQLSRMTTVAADRDGLLPNLNQVPQTATTLVRMSILSPQP